jgi:hypothetical protein
LKYRNGLRIRRNCEHRSESPKITLAGKALSTQDNAHPV